MALSGLHDMKPGVRGRDGSAQPCQADVPAPEWAARCLPSHLALYLPSVADGGPAGASLVPLGATAGTRLPAGRIEGGAASPLYSANPFGLTIMLQIDI